MNEAEPVDRHRPSRRPPRLQPIRLTLRLLVFGAVLSGTPLVAKTPPGVAHAGAPATPTAAAEPPILSTPGGVHYQVLEAIPVIGAEPATGSSPPSVVIFLPRPPFDDWDSVSVTSNAPCLELGSLEDPGAGYVLAQTAVAIGEQMSPAAAEAPAVTTGMICDAVLDVSFVSEPSTWQTSLSVHLFRPVAEPYAGDDITASLSVSRLMAASSAPGSSGQRVLLLEVKVTNLTAEPIELLGLIDPSGISRAAGQSYRIPAERLLGTVRELQELTGSTQSIAIAPNDHVRLGLVFDPEAQLAQTGGTLTAQPAVLVRVGGESYSLLLNRVSTAWGDDLP